LSRAAPPWLEEFQRDFSAMLRAPLDGRTGTLRAPTERFSAALVDGTLAGPSLGPRDRLAVYNRQYWFRLFGVLQSEFRLTSAIAGPWTFNEVATAFLLSSPPRGHDLALVAEGFADHIAKFYVDRALPLPDGSAVPGLALAQAARLDDAFRGAFWAREPDVGEVAAFQGLRPDALASGRLRPSGRFFLVEEDWPLLTLRGESGPACADERIPLPPRHPARAFAAVFRGATGIRVLPLTPSRARLYHLLLELPLAAALARLESEASDPERATLARHVQSWLAESVRLGFWEGVDPC
jgi:hypothetical protein